MSFYSLFLFFVINVSTFNVSDQTLRFGLLLQWSLHFKTIHSARKIGSYIGRVLKWRDIYIENIKVVMVSLKMEGIVK